MRKLFIEKARIHSLNINDIKEYLRHFYNQRFEYNIWVIANVSDTIQNEEDFIEHTNFSEFFSKAEFASIISAITELYGYVRIFYSETELMTYVLNNKYNLNTQKIIIYNFARDGICEGKKSLIPAFCNLFGLRYTGSNPFVISLLRNKKIYTSYLGAYNIPVPVTRSYKKHHSFSNHVFKKEYLIVKHIYESASIGMTEQNIIKNCQDYPLEPVLDELCSNMKSDEILVQDYIKGRECEVFVIKKRNEYFAFPPIELSIHNSEIITTSISDTFDYSFSPLERNISNQICNAIMNSAKKAADLLVIDTYARFDFRVNSEGEFYLIDIAGTPYITRHSSIAYLFINYLKLQYTDIFLLLGALTQK